MEADLSSTQRAQERQRQKTGSWSWERTAAEFHHLYPCSVSLVGKDEPQPWWKRAWDHRATALPQVPSDSCFSSWCCVSICSAVCVVKTVVLNVVLKLRDLWPVSVSLWGNSSLMKECSKKAKPKVLHIKCPKSLDSEPVIYSNTDNTKKCVCVHIFKCIYVHTHFLKSASLCIAAILFQCLLGSSNTNTPHFTEWGDHFNQIIFTKKTYKNH